jgi:hypothetical protein
LNGTGTATARKRHQGDWERQPSREACPCHPTTQSLYPTEADIDRAYHPFPKDDAWKQVTLEYCAKEGRRLILGCCGCQREKMVWPRLYAEEHGIPMNIPLLILARLIRYTTCGQRLITSWASPGQLSMTCSASHVFSGLRRPARVPKLWSCNFSDVADAANSQLLPATKPRWRLRSRVNATLCDGRRPKMGTLANHQSMSLKRKPSACGTSSTASLLVLATRLNRGPGRAERQSLRLHHAEPSRALAVVPHASENSDFLLTQFTRRTWQFGASRLTQNKRLRL